MDITRYNFEEELDSIKKVIEESTFLAIDGEFTGLSHGSEGRLCSFDSPADRYRKIRNGASDFLLIQFGLCAFKADEEKRGYEAKPYNFYIFPRPSDNQSPDRRFLCQSSSIEFLMSNDFDFNKLFKEGIPYLTFDQEAKLRANLEQRQTDRNNSFNSLLRSPDGVQNKKTPFVVPEDHKEFIAKIREKVDAYLKSEESEPLALPPCNAFQRKLIYRSMEQDFPLVSMETKTGDNKERYIAITKFIDTNHAEEKEKSRQAMERMKLDLQVGFTKVMRFITESGKLVVGHNMYLDVIHSMNHFYGPIPPELEDFKEMISSVFPQLLDTKLMASTNPLKEYFYGTSLEELMLTMKHPPFKAAQVDLSEGFTKYSEGGTAFHEAGYDAFVTGSCFASMINFLGRFQTPSSNFVLPTHQSVQPFVNKLFMMRISDIPYVNLSGADVEPNRDHVFHVTFPEEWKSSDLHQLFEPYGNVQISWLTGTTAYVGLLKKENAKLATTSLCQGLGTFHVISYSSHRHMMQMKSHITPLSTPSATPSSRSKLDAAGVKRRSPPTDAVYPPTKLPRRSLTKETLPYPSIPEEDEPSANDEKTEVEEPKMEEEEEEDLGEPVTNQVVEKKISKGVGSAKVSNKVSLSGDSDAKVSNKVSSSGVGSTKVSNKVSSSGIGSAKVSNKVSSSGDGDAKVSNKVSSNEGKLFEEPDTW